MTIDEFEPHHPVGVELQQDVSAADWIAPRLLPISRAAGTRVCAIVPQGYEAYIRVFHHTYEQVGETWVRRRWSDIAERTGRQMHPAVQFDRFSAANGPNEGSLDEAESTALVAILREHTATPEECWLAIWHGYGFMVPGGSTLFGDWEPGLRGWLKRQLARQPQVKLHADLAHAPTISLPNREYYLYRGPIDVVKRFEFGRAGLYSPNLWWPNDRAWIVASEIDFDSTLVACNRACAAALLASDLETLEIEPESRLDIDGDTINPRLNAN